MREILQNVAKQQGVSNMRKLGHLNNFIKVCHLKSGAGNTKEEIVKNESPQLNSFASHWLGQKNTLEVNGDWNGLVTNIL